MKLIIKISHNNANNKEKALMNKFANLKTIMNKNN